MKTVINNEGQKVKISYITYNELKGIFQDTSVESALIKIKGKLHIIPNFFLLETIHA